MGAADLRCVSFVPFVPSVPFVHCVPCVPFHPLHPFHSECTVACTGQVTEAQLNVLQDGCDTKGRKAYMQNGGNEDDYMMEMEKVWFTF